MNEAQKKQLKKIMKDRIDELTLLLQPGDQADATNDESARLDSQISASVDMQVLESATQELRLLHRNVNWLDSEEGGYCEDCGCEIQTARLLALPATRCCVDCANKRENAQ